jgi:UDP-N-acetylglucosamine transferase subunit ALG13
LPGFRLKYGKNRAFTLLKIIFTLPKILIGIKRENAWLRRFVAREGLHVVISDNRYGLHGAGVFSVFITHQLAIRSSLGAAVDWLLRRVNYAYIRRFSVCWVPDVEGIDNLAGLLSHPRKMPAVPVRYIGWLSRLEPARNETVYDLLILLSGPEPQRTILEKILIQQLDENIGRIVLVRGLPKGGADVKAPKGVVVFDHLGTRELGRVICQSRLVLARSGYSTVMDLVRLRRRAVYIPTPGQPEQEYLGRHIQERGLGICMQQRGFILKEAVGRARVLSNPEPSGPNEVLGEEIRRVLAQSGAGPPGSIGGGPPGSIGVG